MTHVLPGLLDVAPDPSGDHFFTGPAAGWRNNARTTPRPFRGQVDDSVGHCVTFS